MPLIGDRWPPLHWSVRAQVTVIATLIVASFFLVGVIVFYAAVRHTGYDGLDKRGSAAAAGLVARVRATDPHGALPVQNDGFSLLQVVDDSGQVIAASDALRGHAPLKPDPPRVAGRPEAETVRVPGVASRVYVVSERVQTDGGWRIVSAGTPVSGFEHGRSLVGLLGLTAMAGTGAVAWIVAGAVRRALHPVRVMCAELAEITGGEPDRRVTVPRSRDEVAELAESVNVTLRRLEDVLARQRAFVADVSHELRSPLTGLRAQLEVALQRPADEDWPAVAQAALGDTDRLQGIVADLLVMARLEAGVQAEREPVDLGDLVRAETRRRSQRVPVRIEADAGIVVRASRDHLIRVLTNLLDNAERHARSCVRVSCTVDGRDAVLEVADDGSGIPPEDRERVFHRFQRLAEARTRDRGGTGLGLPIARDIAVAHGGSLVAAAGDQGARLVLRLPLAAGNTKIGYAKFHP